MTESAFSNDDPAVVALYLANEEACRAAGLRAIADAWALGGLVPLVRRGVFSQPDEITGLDATVEQRLNPPAGWAWVAKHRQLRPVRGQAGGAARAWLADHPLPPDARSQLAQHGLPLYARSGADLSRYRLSRPHTFHHDGTLWARYRGEIDGTCTWTPRKLSEFHDALERAVDQWAAWCSQQVPDDEEKVDA